MSDSSPNSGQGDLSSSDVINDQSVLNLNNSINGTLNSIDDTFGISDDTKRMFFIAIATITVLICLIICIYVCIRICLKRRRKLEQRKNKDHLLPEQSEKIPNRKSSKILSNNPSTTNGKQGSSNQPTTINATKVATKPFYYDNLDDIPFIDESRPTSVIDITQV